MLSLAPALRNTVVHGAPGVMALRDEQFWGRRAKRDRNKRALGDLALFFRCIDG
jgi:hypothetical protein